MLSTLYCIVLLKYISLCYQSKQSDKKAGFTKNKKKQLLKTNKTKSHEKAIRKQLYTNQ